MSKNYKNKKETKPTIMTEEGLSKKEQYDLQKRQKQAKKKKEQSKKSVSKKKKRHQTNLGTRIFAIIMLVLMIASVIASIATYIR